MILAIEKNIDLFKKTKYTILSFELSCFGVVHNIPVKMDKKPNEKKTCHYYFSGC